MTAMEEHEGAGPNVATTSTTSPTLVQNLVQSSRKLVQNVQSAVDTSLSNSRHGLSSSRHGLSGSRHGLSGSRHSLSSSRHGGAAAGGEDSRSTQSQTQGQGSSERPVQEDTNRAATSGAPDESHNSGGSGRRNVATATPAARARMDRTTGISNNNNSRSKPNNRMSWKSTQFNQPTNRQSQQRNNNNSTYNNNNNSTYGRNWGGGRNAQPSRPRGQARSTGSRAPPPPQSPTGGGPVGGGSMYKATTRAKAAMSSFSSGGAPAQRSPRGKTQPLSYSKATQLNGDSADGQGDDITRELQSERAGLDSGPAVKSLADEAFTSGSGVSDYELRRILNDKGPSPTQLKRMELPQQLDIANDTIARLKDTVSSLMMAKNKFVSDAIDAERNARRGWNRALQSARNIDEDRNALKNKVKQLEVDRTIWKDNAKDSIRELGVAEEKLQSLRDELNPLKKKLAEAEQAKTESVIALEVAKAGAEAQEKQVDVWKAEIAMLQASKAEAVAHAKKSAENDDEKVELRRTLSESSGKIKQLESQLQLKELELLKVVSEKDTAVERATTKDRDLSDLMKSLGDIQRSGMVREEEANNKRREAEGKASELERSLADSLAEVKMLSHERTTLAESLDAAKREIETSGGSLTELKEQFDEIKSERAELTSSLQLERELRSRSEQKESEERTERIALSAQMMAMTKEHAQMETKLNEANEVLETKWRKKLEALEEVIAEREKELAEGAETVAGLEGELESLRTALSDKKSMADAQHVKEIGRLNGEINVMKERLKAEEQKFVVAQEAFEKERGEFEAQLREGMAERRRMHNTIQELRGNVRVFARIRPFLPGDGVDDDVVPSIVPKDEASLKLDMGGKEEKEYNFSFDRVFAPSSSQEAVFQDVSEFVQSALDGFNVCLFSYGQTGSGKTHTMQGSGLGQMRGIIPRAIEQVGRYKQELEAQGWRYEMKVSFLEIYNETIRDLLREDGTEEQKHDIKVGSDGRRFVTNLTMQPLEPTDGDAINDVMQKAAKERTVGSTDMNAVSSRSHSVFTLHLTALHPEQRQALRGTLNLVDLAGSERLKRSGVEGHRAKEAMAINKSLSSLTDVFVAIGTKAGHVPFRNSKLTYLLQPSLSGDGKTLMVVNLSPTDLSTQESLSSLRFASQVNKCELGKAKRSIEEVKVEDDDDDVSMSSKTSMKSDASSVKGMSVPGTVRRGAGGGKNSKSPTGRGVANTPMKRAGANSSSNGAPRKRVELSSRSTSNVSNVSSASSGSRRAGGASSSRPGR